MTNRIQKIAACLLKSMLALPLCVSVSALAAEIPDIKPVLGYLQLDSTTYAQVLQQLRSRQCSYESFYDFSHTLFIAGTGVDGKYNDQVPMSSECSNIPYARTTVLWFDPATSLIKKIRIDMSFSDLDPEYRVFSEYFDHTFRKKAPDVWESGNAVIYFEKHADLAILSIVSKNLDPERQDSENFDFEGAMSGNKEIEKLRSRQAQEREKLAASLKSIF